MNQRFVLKAAAAAVVLSMATAAFADDVDFKMHGYIRSGLLITKDMARGNDLTLMSQLGSAHFRLGNEQNTKIELIPQLKIRNGDGAVATIQANLTHETKCSADWDCVDGDGHDMQVREGYAQLENLLIAPSAVFWAGKRYSSSNTSSHQYDWEYIQYNGTGGGVDKIDLGFARLDVGLYAFNANKDASNGSNGRPLKDSTKQGYADDYSLNVWLKGIAGTGLDLQAVAHTREPNDWDKAGAATRGFGFTGVYNFKGFYYLGEGYSRATIQYGNGLAAGASLGKNGWGENNRNATKSARFVLDGLYQSNGLDISTFAFIQKDKHYRWWDDSDGQDRTVYAVGVRPYHQLSRNFALQYELGYEHSKMGDVNGGLVKATVSPTLTMGQGYWTRPALRLNLTYAKWDKEVSSLVDSTYTNDSKTSALTFGVTGEAWF